MNAHFSTSDPRHLLGESAIRLGALFLKALGRVEKARHG
jgi:hypothetical protein